MPDVSFAGNHLPRSFAPRRVPQSQIARSLRPQRTYQGPDIIIDGPCPEPEEADLYQAIDNAPPAELRRLLRSIVSQNEAANTIATDRLLAPIPGTAGRRQMAFATCANCQNPFDVRRNGMGCCVYHKGPKMADGSSDVWADANEGDTEMFFDDPEFQHGYYWSCCGQDGDSKGCVIARHSGAEDPARRNFRRPETVEEDSEEQDIDDETDGEEGCESWLPS